jgi:hypothetical protein
MLDLSSSYIQGKNTLHDKNPMIMLLKWVVDTQTQRFACNASEDIAWDGETWVAMPMNIGAIRFAKNEVPQLAIQIADPSGTVHALVEQYSGAEDSIVDIYCVYYGDLAETENIPHFTFQNIGCRIKSPFVYFTLGVKNNPADFMDPSDKILKNFCRFRFGNANDPRCPYTGTETSCDKTLSACQERNGVNASQFGAFPAIGTNKIYV